MTTTSLETSPTLQHRNVIVMLLMLGGVIGQYGGNRASFVALSFSVGVLGITLALVWCSPRPIMILGVVVMSLTSLRVMRTPGHSGLGEVIWLVCAMALLSLAVAALVGARWPRSKSIQASLRAIGTLLVVFAIAFDPTGVGRSGDTLFRAAIRLLTGSDVLGERIAYFVNQYSLLGVAMFVASYQRPGSGSQLASGVRESSHLPPAGRMKCDGCGVEVGSRHYLEHIEGRGHLCYECRHRSESSPV